jgi:hypothetical protein
MHGQSGTMGVYAPRTTTTTRDAALSPLAPCRFELSCALHGKGVSEGRVRGIFRLRLRARARARRREKNLAYPLTPALSPRLVWNSANGARGEGGLCCVAG